MKLVLLVLVTLLAPAAFAAELPCETTLQRESGQSTYLLGPSLLVQNGPATMRVPFGYAGAFYDADFGNNLCRACGWGQTSTALTFARFSQPYVAYLDSQGQLERLGKPTQRADSLGEIDSLTCVR